MKWCVYMLVADAGDGFSFCKIGITGNLAERIRSIQVGCPVPITAVAYMDLPANHCRSAERIFHAQLTAYHSQGEWFRLRLTDPAHKEAFAAATKAALRWVGASGTKWKSMEPDAIKMLTKVLRLDKAA